MGSAAQSSLHREILLVDDEKEFCDLVSHMLSSRGFKVTTAYGGRAAQHLVAISTFDCVIADIRMPDGNGIELLHYVRHTKPRLPVILMTGFAELRETEEAHDLGAKAFLAKPFSSDDLVQMLETLLGGVSSPGEKNVDDEFFKLGITDFITGHEMKQDIYIRLSETKYIKIAHQGEDIPGERIRSYKEKGIRHLYMKKEDFRKYVGMNVALVPHVAQSGIEKSRRLGFLKHTAEMIVERVFIDGIDEESFDHAKTVVESTTSLLTEQSDVLTLLTVLSKHTDYLYGHSLAVALYGILLAKRAKWHAPLTLFKVGVGGLFHDIGMKEIEPQILNKPRTNRTHEENRIFETHPMRGAEILSSLPHLPSDIVHIVMQHHENCLGMGFPQGLPKDRIHPMARLISVANEFCLLAMSSPQGSALSPRQAIERMIAVNPGRFDRLFLANLIEAFGLPASQLLPKARA